ncbi:MAG: photosynthetic complex assembly protein PuhC [Paracoccaceae bacterium]|nr:photosynthetic complex assembly protein PuhC [Paracoccaceae bacterium]
MTDRSDTGLYFDAEARVMQKRDKEVIPRRLVIAMFSLALATLLLTTFAVLTDRPLVGQPEAAPIYSQRSLLIEPDGKAVLVTDVRTGEVVLDAENGGFVSVVTDGLQRARHVAGVGENAPVLLTLYENSRLSLSDPASDWSMEISSFGPGNTGVWLELLKKK